MQDNDIKWHITLFFQVSQWCSDKERVQIIGQEYRGKIHRRIILMELD